MNKKNFSDLENQIRFMVDKSFKAVEEIDLNNIKDKSSYAMNRVRKKATEYGKKYNIIKEKQSIKRYINKKPNGKIKGYLYIFIGGLGIVTFSALLLILSIISAVVSGGTFIGAGILLVFLLGSIGVLARGITLRSRLTRFKKYIKCMNNRNIVLIGDLARLAGVKTKFLIKDLQKMNELDMFLEGHIDDEKNCFMLGNDVYMDYLNSKQMGTEVDEEEEEEIIETGEKSIIEISREYISKINSIKARLNKVDLRNKLEVLVSIANQINNYVEDNPNKMKDIHKFVTYYLPTVIKLIDSYSELDKQKIQSENIKSAKLEIENSIDTINIAFERLLDELYEEEAIDISADISVLKTLFKQEGLTEKDFKK